MSFNRNYSEDHVIRLPGCIPAYKQSDLQLLPCSTSKHSIWRMYSNAASQHGHIRSVAYAIFCHTWRKLLLNILPTLPRRDLYAVCHRNAGLISRSGNLSEAEKSQVRVTLLFLYLLA